MKKPILFLITVYQKVLSPDTGFLPALFGRNKPTCTYYPTCSEYAKEAIVEHGVLRGGKMAIARIGRCNPFHSPAVDPVPKKK